MSLVIKLVRHGESLANVGDLDPTVVGDHTIGLTDLGKIQARQAGERIGKDYLAGAPKGADAALDSACTCVSAALATQFSQSVVDFLGEQLAAADPSAAAAAATPEQDAAGQAAEQVMGQCLAPAMAG